MATLAGKYEPCKSPYQLMDGKFLLEAPKAIRARLLAHTEAKAEEALASYENTDWKPCYGKVGKDADICEEKPGMPWTVLRWYSSNALKVSPFNAYAVTGTHHVKAKFFSDTVLKYEMVSRVSNHCDLVKCISTPALGGIISSREFLDVICNYRCKETGAYFSFGTAALDEAYDLAPFDQRRIAGKNFECLTFYHPVEGKPDETSLVYSFYTDPQGGLPKWALRKAMPQTMQNYAANMRKILNSFPTLEALVRDAPEAAGR
eukprot:TRINITY_DN97746_c0_g1_i1.p1 TRINITY_DN97746_c0_g1~~TRINITY_DN97746_c0_g1_i1.p1  ORF type:complete len:278 (+),score=54.48 TRINITY_DN97746_c0_g1_i1:52-834(+)